MTISIEKQQQKSENICRFCSFQSSIQGESNVNQMIPEYSKNDAFY